MREHAADVVVVGAGPGGLAAAVTAAECGRSVLLVDDNAAPGGQIWRASFDHGMAAPARAWHARAERAGVQRLSGTRVVDARDARTLIAAGDAGMTILRANRIVLALGASERFLPFPGWTLPGVFGVGGLQALAKGGFDLRGAVIAIAGSGPLLLAVAASLRARGAQIAGIFEQAPLARVRRFGIGLAARPRKLAQGLALLGALRGIERHHDAWPLHAEPAFSGLRVTFRTPRGNRVLPVTALAVGFGLVPNTDVAALLGCRMKDERVVVDELTCTTIDGVHAVGETIGIAGVDAAIADGITAGLVCAGRDDEARRAARRRFRERRFAAALERTYALRDELRTLATGDTLVCRCEDVPLARLADCMDARDAKLRTRCGMGPCQGRVCGPALGFLRGWPRDDVRPPLIPLTFSAWLELGTTGPRGRTDEMARSDAGDHDADRGGRTHRS
ncbi:MAG: NAD(P)/FAD-dependent oxidoreductase [Planctomycetes bacterium]|nr:NAD(P)/FAD-dependent oxidoreductase [Planctomycetota bacterium]